MINRTQKEELVHQLRQLKENNTSIFFCTYANVTAAEFINIRRKLRKANIKVKVVKNSLINKAFPQLELKNSTCCMFSADEVSAVARVINQICTESKKLQCSSVVTNEGDLGDGQLFLKLVKRPTKDQVLINIIALLHSPWKQIVEVVNYLPKIIK